MQDSSDQTTHQLQQEIKKLKKTLAQKDRKLSQKDKELDIERRLWKNRAADWDPGDSTDLHRIEVFGGIISDESSLYSATLKTKKKFQHILEHAEVYVAASDKMRLFRDDESRTSDPGNRCKLRLRHAILMALVHKKDNPTQGVLQAIFGIDQTSVCRYLKVMDRILAEALPTANNISQQIIFMRDQGGIQEDSARGRRGRHHNRRHALPGPAPVRKDRQAHEVLWKEEAGSPTTPTSASTPRG